MAPGGMLDGAEHHVAHDARIDGLRNFAVCYRVIDHLDEDRRIAAVELLNGGAAIVAGDAHLRDEKPAEIALRDECRQMLADQNVELLAKALSARHLGAHILDQTLVELA